MTPRRVADVARAGYGQIMCHLPPYPDLAIESDRQVWDGRFPLHSIRFRHRRFDGMMSGERRWELWHRGKAAAILPYDPAADAVVLLEQFRLPALAAGVKPIMVELPAGLCEPGETAEQTVLREMKEEIGLSSSRLETIGDFVLSPGGSDECCTLFIGQVTAPPVRAGEVPGSFGLATEQEDIRVCVLPSEDAIARALAGEYANSVTAIALLWFANKREWLRKRWADR